MIKKIYIAGPLFNVHEKKYLEDIAAVLEEAGYECFVPHRDKTKVSGLVIDPEEFKDNNMTQSTKDAIFKADLDALNWSDATVALITGQDIDSGTASEIGYMYANNKPPIALFVINLFTAGMFSSTINNIGDLLGVIKTIDS